MINLTRIVRSLSPNELRLIHRFYKSKPKNDIQKRVLLLDLVMQEEYSDASAALELYGKKPNSAFSQLKKRLREDILNVILLESGDRKYESKFIQAEFDCRKKLMQGDVLLKRGVYKEGLRLLMEANKIAERYELLGEVIVLQDIISTHLGFRDGVEVYDGWRKKISTNFERYSMLLEAKEKMNYVTLPSQFKSNKETTDVAFAMRSLNRLRQLWERSNSGHIGFWYFKVAVNFYYSNKEFETALEHANNLKNIVAKRQEVYSKTNMAGAHLSTGVIHAHLHQYDSAVEETIVAADLFKQGMMNEFNTRRIVYLCYLQGGQLEKAAELLARLKENRYSRPGTRNGDIIKFMEAGLQFLRKDFDSLAEFFHEKTTLSRDKSGWYIGYKLLEMQLLLETADYDFINNRMDNFRKLLASQPPHIIKRPRQIYDLLRHLLRYNFDYNRLLENEAHELGKLRVDPDFYWDPLGYEIIRFENWVEDMANKRHRSQN